MPVSASPAPQPLGIPGAAADAAVLVVEMEGVAVREGVLDLEAVRVFERDRVLEKETVGVLDRVPALADLERVGDTEGVLERVGEAEGVLVPVADAAGAAAVTVLVLVVDTVGVAETEGVGVAEAGVREGERVAEAGVREGVGEAEAREGVRVAETGVREGVGEVEARVGVRVSEAETALVRVVEMVGVGEGGQLATSAVEPAAHMLAQPQGVHSLLPEAAEYVPAGQNAQSQPSMLYLPSPHTTQ